MSIPIYGPIHGVGEEVLLDIKDDGNEVKYLILDMDKGETPDSFVYLLQTVNGSATEIMLTQDELNDVFVNKEHYDLSKDDN